MRRIVLGLLAFAMWQCQAAAGFTSSFAASKNLTSVVSGGTVVNFESVAAGTYGPAAGLTTNGVNFKGLSGGSKNLFVGTPDAAGTFNMDGSKYLYNKTTNPATNQFEFTFLNSTVSAFAFLVGKTSAQWRVTAFDSSNAQIGSTFVIPIQGTANSNFYVLWQKSAGENAAKRVELNDGNDILYLDNLTYASFSAAPVPEPTSLALWGLGAVGVAVARRRRKVSHTA